MVNFIVRELTGCSYLMVVIWALREFPCDITTGHVTYGNTLFNERTGLVLTVHFVDFEDDGLNDTLCKY